MCVSLKVKRFISLFVFGIGDRQLASLCRATDQSNTHFQSKKNQPCTTCGEKNPLHNRITAFYVNQYLPAARLQSTPPQRRCSTKDQRKLAGESVIKWHLSVLRAVLESVHWHPGLLWFSKCLVRM